MYQRSRSAILAAILSVTVLTTAAQTVKQPTITNKEWETPYPPFRIAGNLYYVGTRDLAAYFITTRRGNILINTGLAGSEELIKKNIETLGFKYKKIRILLTTQAHFDHMGAMAAIRKQTNAKLMVDAAEADVVKDGGSSDYALGGHGSSFEPVMPDRLLHDSDIVKLGKTKLQVLHHPGHTKGSCSFLLTVKDDQRSYRVLIANMPTIVTDSSFTNIPAYPKIAADYAYTLNGMKNIHFDIWVASHASQFKLHDKHKPGDVYNPAAFFDQAGYDALLKDLQEDYDEKMRK
ncbi:subclass B3 metallo-beta-lactamase [Ferruginibacter sp.]